MTSFFIIVIELVKIFVLCKFQLTFIYINDIIETAKGRNFMLSNNNNNNNNSNHM